MPRSNLYLSVWLVLLEDIGSEGHYACVLHHIQSKEEVETKGDGRIDRIDFFSLGGEEDEEEGEEKYEERVGCNDDR